MEPTFGRFGLEALCQTLFDGVEEEDSVNMYIALWEAAKNAGIKKVGERTNLLWKLSKKRGDF